MSQAEIERFVADLTSNANLRAEAEKLQPDKSQALSVDAFVSFAAGRGYSFSAEEVTACIEAARAKPNDKQLSDAKLDTVAGGGTGDPWQHQISTAV